METLQDQAKNLKKELRAKMKVLKNSVPMQERIRLSDLIMEKVEQLEEFSKATTILLYYSLPDEVQTAAFLEKWAVCKTDNCSAKRLVLPVVDGEDLILKEYKPGMLESGYQNILEPTNTTIINPSEIDFALVPGVAFDLNNNRLGRGKGFYDRLLPALSCPVFGLAYPFQIVEQVPTESFDKKLDGLVTL